MNAISLFLFIVAGSAVHAKPVRDCMKNVEAEAARAASDGPDVAVDCYRSSELDFTCLVGDVLSGRALEVVVTLRSPDTIACEILTSHLGL